jgi:hypothetical protein
VIEQALGANIEEICVVVWRGDELSRLSAIRISMQYFLCEITPVGYLLDSGDHNL